MFDVAVIGSGPAGISAAINLKVLGKDFIWFSSRTVSKKVSQAELIKNYPGLPDITGEELGWTFKNHYEGMGIKLTEEVVTGVYETDGKFTLLARDKQYEAKAVILCLGVEASKPLEAEENFVGRGVSYCATCDDFLYKDKTVAIYCTDKKFEHEIEFLCGLAKTAYVMPMYKDCTVSCANAHIIQKQPVKLSGDMRLRKIHFKDGEIEADGLFILKGALSPATLVHGLQIDNGHIAVNRDLSTNISGVFAAGDCTGRPYQYVKAAGEGNVAAHSAVEYIAENKN